MPPAPARYAAGDLFAEYAIHADVIQIVRVQSHRTPRDRWASWLGNMPVEAADFTFVPVRTLAATPFARTSGTFRVRGFSRFWPDADEYPVVGWGTWRTHFLAEHLQRPDAGEPVPAAEAYPVYFCSFGSYMFADGDVLIAIRRHAGDVQRVRYVSAEPNMPPLIFLAMPLTAARRDRLPPLSRDAPSLFRIRGLNDPVIALLEQRIREQRAAREARARAALWRDALRLIFGRPIPDADAIYDPDAER